MSSNRKVFLNENLCANKKADNICLNEELESLLRVYSKNEILDAIDGYLEKNRVS